MPHGIEEQMKMQMIYSKGSHVSDYVGEYLIYPLAARILGLI